MSSAAASSSRRRAADKEKEAKRRAAVRKKRQARERRTREVIERLLVDGEDALPESRVREVLAEALGMPEADLDPNAVELVIDTARRKPAGDGEAAESAQSAAPNGQDGAITKEGLLGAVNKYGEYVRKSKEIDGIFEAFDKNKDGVIDRQELMNALQDRERKADRHAMGVNVTLVITDEDLDFILEHSDASHDGKISRSELLPALAAWEELADAKIQKMSSCACALM